MDEMTHDAIPALSPSEARAMLDTVERERRRVADEIGVPRWYWWGLAAGWMGLAVLSDQNWAWVTLVATLAFGAVHAAIAPRVIDGRHGTRRLAVGRSVAGRHVSTWVIVGLLSLVVLDVVVAVALDADGARHPGIASGVLCAVVILLGGPLLMARVRRSAQLAAR